MRETYPPCTATIKVLSQNTEAIAKEADFDASMLRGILAGVQSDPFAKFKRYYAAAIRAGVDVTAWDADLAEIRTRYRPGSKATIAAALNEKIATDAKTSALIVTALEDGTVSDVEFVQIEQAIAMERATLERLETSLHPNGVVQMKRKVN